MEIPKMSSRRVTDEDGRVWECKSETEEAPGCDLNIVCTTAGLQAPLRLKVSWQWSTIAEKGLARMIVAAAPPFTPDSQAAHNKPQGVLHPRPRPRARRIHQA